MNIQQAIFKSRVQRAVGALLLLGGATFYFVSLLLAIYETSREMGQSQLLWRLGHLIQNLVAGIYDASAPFIGFVWSNAPTLNQRDPFSYGNLLFLGLLGVMMTGGQLLRAGRNLRRRVQRQLDRIEEYQWRQSLQQGVGAVVHASQVGQINIYQQPMPPTSEAEWWQRPIGAMGLTIIGGYAVAVLVKLTGMV